MKTCKFQEWSDEQLVASIQMTGDLNLFGPIYERYFDRVFYTCLGVVKNVDYARDLAQEAMLKALERINSLNNAQMFGLWLHRIAKNLSIDHYKKQQSMYTDAFDDTLDFVDEVLDVEYIQERERRFDRLELAMKQISEVDRKLLTQKYLEKQSIKDLQKQDPLSSGALKMRLNRAKKRVLNAYYA